jgi:hypothetical protein
MMAKEPNTSTKDNPLVRALSRWENEGGRTDTDWEAVRTWPARPMRPHSRIKHHCPNRSS